MSPSGLVEGLGDGRPGIGRGLVGLGGVDDAAALGQALEAEALAAPEQGGGSRPVDFEDESGARAHAAARFWSRRSKAIFVAPRRSGGAGVGDGLLEPLERVAGRDQAPEAGAGHDLEGQLEGSSHRRRPPLGAVGVGADQRELTVPEGCEVDRHPPGHADHHHTAAGADHGERLLQRVPATHAVEDDVGPFGESAAQDEGTRPAAHGASQLVGRDGGIGPEQAGEVALVLVLGAHQERGRCLRAHQLVECGHRGQPQGAGSDNGHEVVGLDVGGQRGVYGAGRRLYHHCVLVGETLGDRVNL